MLMPQITYQLFEEGLFHNELATFCRHSSTQDLTFKIEFIPLLCVARQQNDRKSSSIVLVEPFSNNQFI